MALVLVRCARSDNFCYDEDLTIRRNSPILMCQYLLLISNYTVSVPDYQICEFNLLTQGLYL
ncbi:hypothetical protein AsFPU3_2892 [Aphanothece sacrum FPU3]|nr:hypothetical protein AsFPU3_2892 [Aphanothece sacrum FPU3]